MAYRALYRQWRPMDFSHLVGQEAIVETLRNQIMSDRIAHAYLFCGSRGTGKTSIARILSRAINCEHPENGDPCGKCPNCLRPEEESLDVTEIDAASNNGVDEMRDLRESVKYPPQFGRYKVYIIDEVHMLSANAFNALLKTLEEPPAHVVFVLATTEPQKLPATILSRCQRFDFGRIPANQIVGRLREAAEGAGRVASDGALMRIARAAEGGMRDALSILDMCLGYGGELNEALVRNVLGTSDRSFLFRFSRALAERNAAEILHMIDEVMRGGREPAVFAKDISAHLRALLTARCCGENLAAVLEMTEEDAAEYRQEAEHFTVTRLMDMLDCFMHLETEMRYASSPRIMLENIGMKCCLRTTEADQQALLDQIDELRHQVDDLKDKLQQGQFSVAAPVQENGKASGKASTGKENGNGPQALATQAAAFATTGAEGLSGEQLWKEVQNQLKKNDPSIFGMLKMGNFKDFDGKLLRWQTAEGNDFYAQVMNVEKHRKSICQVLKTITGKDCDFQAVVKSDEVQKKNAEEDYIQPLFETFGKENVVVMDQPGNS